MISENQIINCECQNLKIWLLNIMSLLIYLAI